MNGEPAEAWNRYNKWKKSDNPEILNSKSEGVDWKMVRYNEREKPNHIRQKMANILFITHSPFDKHSGYAALYYNSFSSFSF